MEESTGKQVVRAWAIFSISLVGWLLLLVSLAHLVKGGFEISIWLHLIVALVLLLMLFVALLVTAIWLFQKLAARIR